MKRTLVTVFILSLAQLSFGQTFPTCADFQIEKISLTDSGYAAVEMSNNCTDCAEGLLSCTYAEMKVINRDDATDTLAASDCYCLMAPPNGGSQVYLLPSSRSTLPPLASMRVYFECTQPACEDVGFSALPVSEHQVALPIRVYPNPAQKFVRIDAEGQIALRHIRLSDVLGRVVKTFDQEARQLNVSELPRGLYFLQMVSAQGTLRERLILE